MSANLSFPGRAELAGYAGLAGSVFTGRTRPVAVILAVDVLAVALAFGALQVTGAMMGGAHKEQQPAFIAPTEVAAGADAAAPAIVMPPPRLAPEADVALAATTDATILFAPPVGMAAGFTTGFSGASSDSFTPPPETVASNPPPVVGPEEPVVTAPQPSLATVVKHRTTKAVTRVDQTVTSVTDVADDSLDRLLLRDIPSTAAGLSSTVNGTATVSASGGTYVGTAAAATVTASAASVSSTVNQTVSNVTQSASQVVSKVTGLLN